MFIEFAKKRLGIKPRLISPEALRIIPDPTNDTGFKLCCLAQAGAVDTITIDKHEDINSVFLTLD
jgi:hypothetical protein